MLCLGEKQEAKLWFAPFMFCLFRSPMHDRFSSWLKIEKSSKRFRLQYFRVAKPTRHQLHLNFMSRKKTMMKKKNCQPSPPEEGLAVCSIFKCQWIYESRQILLGIGCSKTQQCAICATWANRNFKRQTGMKHSEANCKKNSEVVSDESVNLVYNNSIKICHWIIFSKHLSNAFCFNETIEMSPTRVRNLFKGFWIIQL